MRFFLFFLIKIEMNIKQKGMQNKTVIKKNTKRKILIADNDFKKMKFKSKTYQSLCSTFFFVTLRKRILFIIQFEKKKFNLFHTFVSIFFLV